MNTQFKIHRLPEVISMTGLSRSSIYAMMASGQFPQSIKLGARAIGWRSDNLAAWFESRGVAK
ncbi:AlpA family transcriptional regulator [Chitinibacter sp. GC72]|uniref:helix-turn-helix transcriptional regulator n=1 Tax=Chitinibacter sp. GC72 TaxID=1526917 RepID=UPI0012F9D2AB|nr:AlpA family phage regulatory protein [Chitinibacter sp. GC72]